MRLRKFYLACYFLLISAVVTASDLKIEGIEWSRDVAPLQYKVKFTVLWNNSWRNERNYDAAWIFLKYTGTSYQQASYRHAKLMPTGHQLLINHIAGSSNPVIEIPDDRIGLFIYPSAKYRGANRWTIELILDTAILHDTDFNPNSRLIEAYGIEMVQVPQAAFTIGEGDTVAAWKNYSLFISDGNGRPAGLWKVNAENENIPVGKEKGNLFYNVQTPLYQGDQQGIIPAAFPKGFQSFYIMKYETTQGQYAAFLNCISNGGTATRANFGGRDYYTNR